MKEVSDGHISIEDSIYFLITANLMHLDYEKPSTPALKILSQWAHIGLSRATSAVSSFSGDSISFSNPSIDLVEIERLPICFEDSLFNESMCLLQRVKGGIDGYFLFALPLEALQVITLNIIKRVLPNNLFLEEELRASIMSEIANVFSGQLIAGISKANIGIIELTATEQTYDMTGAALDFIACQMGIETDKIAVCNSRFIFQEAMCEVDFWIIANPSSPLFSS